jgi:putative membrane protein
MRGFLLRMLISAFGIWLASEMLVGVEVRTTGTIFAAAFLLGIVNAFVRPILTIVTFPITVLTMGLFLLVINAAMLGLVASFLPGFGISGFRSALLGSLIVSAVSWIASLLIGPSGRVEVVRFDARGRER